MFRSREPNNCRDLRTVCYTKIETMEKQTVYHTCRLWLMSLGHRVVKRGGKQIRRV